MEVGLHWIQFKSKISLGSSKPHVIIVSIFKRYNYSISKEEVVPTMEDDRDEIEHIKKDIDEAAQFQTEEGIIQLFLLDKHRVESIILFTK